MAGGNSRSANRRKTKEIRKHTNYSMAGVSGMHGSKETAQSLITWGSGVSTDIWTSYGGIIMAVSVLPYVIVQFPQISHSKSARHLAVLIALTVSLSLLVCCCLYHEIFQPWIQRRRLAYAKGKYEISGILKHLNVWALWRLLADDGRPNEVVKM